MEKQAFDLMIQRLDAIQRQNEQQIIELHAHMAEEALLRDEVNRHAAYFKIVGIVVTALLTATLSYFGLK